MEQQGSTPPTPPIVQNPEPSLWEQAFKKLSERDRKTLSFPGTAQQDTLERILEATRKSRDVCREKGAKFTLAGRVIIVRDVADKIIAWVDKFKAIGDIIAQYDAGNAALPWAAVRFLLQVNSLLLHSRMLG